MEGMKGAKELAEDADGDYLTADRLLGNMKYYPNVIKSLNDFETPHHIALLKSSDLFKIIHSERDIDYESVNYTEGALVATDCFVHIVFADAISTSSMITSYETISSTNIKNPSQRRRIEINFGNNSSYWRLVEAKTAPDDMLDQTTQYIQTRIQKKSIFRNSVGKSNRNDENTIE